MGNGNETEIFAFEIKINKINVQMTQRVNIVALVSRRSYNRNMITLDLLLHTHTHKHIIYPKKTMKIISSRLFHFSVLYSIQLPSVSTRFCCHVFRFSFCDWRWYDVCYKFIYFVLYLISLCRYTISTLSHPFSFKFRGKTHKLHYCRSHNDISAT